MKRLMLLLWVLASFLFTAAYAVEAGPDTVEVYIVPMEDFPDTVAASIAKFMSNDMKIRVKSTGRIGNLNAAKLPGTNQLIADDVMDKAQPVLRSLPETSDQTNFILLTTQDINSATGGFRYQFSMHTPLLKTSVVSMARMFNYVDGHPVVDSIVSLRLYKMMKRAIGEFHLGWRRSIDRNDVMYSPIMGVQDLDSIGLQHKEDAPEPDTGGRIAF